MLVENFGIISANTNPYLWVSRYEFKFKSPWRMLLPYTGKFGSHWPTMLNWVMILSTNFYIKPEISLALSCFVDKIRTADDTKIMRTTILDPPITNARAPYMVTTWLIVNSSCRSCLLCKKAGCSGSSHFFLTERNFVPDQDRRYITKDRKLPTSLTIPPNQRLWQFSDNLDSDIEDIAPSQSPRHVWLSPPGKDYYRKRPHW